MREGDKETKEKQWRKHEETPTQEKHSLPQPGSGLGSFDVPVRSHRFCLPLGLTAPKHCHILPVVFENGIGLLTTLHSLWLYSNSLAGSSWISTTTLSFHLLSSTHGFIVSCSTSVFCFSYALTWLLSFSLCLHKYFWKYHPSLSHYFPHIWTCLPHRLLAL